MRRYTIEVLRSEDPPEWVIAARTQPPGAPRKMSYGPAVRLDAVEAIELMASLDRRGSLGRVIVEEVEESGNG